MFEVTVSENVKSLFLSSFKSWPKISEEAVHQTLNAAKLDQLYYDQEDQKHHHHINRRSILSSVRNRKAALLQIQNLLNKEHKTPISRGAVK